MASLTRLPRISTIKSLVPLSLRACAVRLAGDDAAAKPPAAQKPAQKPAQPAAPSQANAPAGNQYNVPEYYKYTTFSYYDFEIDMGKSRISQPSKYNPMPGAQKK